MVEEENVNKISLLIVTVMLITVAAVTTKVNAAPVKAEIIEHCEGWGYPYLECVTSGHRWVVVGTANDDVIHGTPFDDVIRTGKGNDVVWAGKGDDMCYVQPRDIVHGCEEQ